VMASMAARALATAGAPAAPGQWTSAVARPAPLTVATAVTTLGIASLPTTPMYISPILAQQHHDSNAYHPDLHVGQQHPTSHSKIHHEWHLDG